VSAGAVVVLLLGGALGAVGGRLLRLPLWPLTGALLGGALVHAAVGGSMTVPSWWSLLAQLLVGTAVGATIVPGLFQQFRAVLLPGLLAVVSIIGIGILCGLAIGAGGRVSDVVAVFGMVPGGVGEMVAAATALHADSAVVAGMHVTRLVLVLSMLPLLLRLADRLGKGRDGGDSDDPDGGADGEGGTPRDDG
jgi:uncharacterized protein